MTSRTVHRAAGRFRTRTDWADTRHSFSFGAHYDPDNVGFGALLVHNDDRVTAGTGYADHAHRDAEIVTWVLSGSLVHADSTGHRDVVHPGRVQRLTAGSGVVHAETNDAYALDPARPAGPVHFVQVWVRPDEAGVTPAYAQREVSLADAARHWLPVVSGGHRDAALTLGSAGSTLWATRLAPGEQRVLPDAPRGHLYVADGAVEVEDLGALGTGDALRLVGDTALLVTALTAAELLFWELG